MTISVTGASGFIGGHLLAALGRAGDCDVRALARSARAASSPDARRVVWQAGDLDDDRALRAFMTADGTVVHLAYPDGWEARRHLALATRIGDIARETGIARLVHCSTAVVAGGTRTPVVTESTPCEPVLDYEHTKLEIEQVLARKAAGAFELVVLRPTAVFGPGGRNLLKLATALTTGRRAVNYLQSSLFGRRRMNLVCVENVVAALLFSVDRRRAVAGKTYIVSDDDDPANNFRDVELALMRGFGLADYAVAPMPLPMAALTLALRAAGRRSVRPDRVYEGSAIVRDGCGKAATLTEGLARFAAWFTQRG
jgi:nucleoside-diphosphate-sugar epimerase